MFAAGSSAVAAVRVLLDAGASLAARDRRNKGIMDYAGDDSPVRALLEERHACCWHCSGVNSAFTPQSIPVTTNHIQLACPCCRVSSLAASVCGYLCRAILTPGRIELWKCLIQDDCAGSGS